MVMENQELVMEKLWKNIMSSMWEPYYVQFYNFKGHNTQHSGHMG